MMIDVNNNKQDIVAGDDSRNLQIVNSVLNINGVTPEEVKSICVGLMQDNFIKLRDEALQVVNDRMSVFVERFSNIVKFNNPTHIESLKSPSIQQAIFTAQKAYALNAECNLDFYIYLLEEMLSVGNSQFGHILFSEAINKTGLLTKRQLQILKVLFEINHMRPTNQKLEMVIRYFEKIIKGLKDLNVTRMDISHLLYTGCVVTYGLAQNPFSSIFKHSLEVNDTGINKEALKDLDWHKYIEMHPQLLDIESTWNNHELCHLLLTSVGMTIAVSQYNLDVPYNKVNYNNLIGDFKY